MKRSHHVLLPSTLVALVIGCGQSTQIPPTTTATGTNAYSIDDVALEVKGDYHMRSPETPPHLTNQPPVVPAAQLFPLFSSRGVTIDVRKTDYRYCNLSHSQWLVLRRQSPPRFPALWSPTVDASGHRLVVTVDFKTDLFRPASMPEATFTNELARMETVIRSATGQTDFTLRP